MSDIKRIIGVSPQETAVAPLLTVKENLELMCGVHGLTNTLPLLPLSIAQSIVCFITAFFLELKPTINVFY